MTEYRYKVVNKIETEDDQIHVLLAIAERLERLVEVIEQKPIHASNTCPVCGQFVALNTLCPCQFSSG